MKNLNIFKRSFTLAMILLMLLNSMVLADNVQNDVVAGGNDTFTLGGSTTVNYTIAPNNGDDQRGCNAEDETPATITILTPDDVIAIPSTLTFTSCETNQSVVFSASTVGNYEITVSVSDSGLGTYNTNPAKFTLYVLKPSDMTPPVITPSVVGTKGNDDWYISNVTVSWTVVDNQSTVSSTTGCGPTTISTDTAGVTLTCSATSAGGTASESVTIKRDATPPSISFELTPPQSGWYNIVSGGPTVTYTCLDAMSGVASCTSPHSFDEGANQSHLGTAVDKAGNSATASVEDVDVDLTNPVITAKLDRYPALSGWFNVDTGAPIVEFDCSDAISDIASCPATYLFGEGEDLSYSGTAYDNAGNSNSAGVVNVDVDLTAPEITWIGGPAEGASPYFGSVPPAPTCTASDELSGPDGCEVTGYSEKVGTHTLTATAYDVAGNETVETRTYKVLPWTLKGFFQPVDMNGVYNTVKGGSTIPLKFEIFAGLTELDLTDYVKSFESTKITCDGSALTDAIEITSTGGTSLRYDSVGGQFIQNWQTPKIPGACYRVTMTTQDGSSLVALFKLK